MANKSMKTLTIGKVTYEITDETARNDISTIKNNLTVDTTLTKPEYAAEAKATGDAIRQLSNDIATLEQDTSNNIETFKQDTTNEIEILRQNAIEIDTSLTQSGKAADSKIVGDIINQLNTEKVQITRTINGKTLDANVVLTHVDIGADSSGSAESALSSAMSYTDTKISELINGAPTTLDTLGEIATAMDENSDVVSALNSAIGSKADVNHDHTLNNLTGVLSIPKGGTGASDAATALIKFGLTATAAELNYCDGVTSSIQTQLNAKAPTSHASSATTYGVSSASNYGHAMASSTSPKANGTAAVGSETAKFARGDHVHPLQTTVSGNAGTATKLETGRTLKVNLARTSASTAFNGSANITDIGVAGKLDITNGGTNATTAAAARKNLGVPTFSWDSSTSTLTITT